MLLLIETFSNSVKISSVNDDDTNQKWPTRFANVLKIAKCEMQIVNCELRQHVYKYNINTNHLKSKIHLYRIANNQIGSLEKRCTAKTPFAIEPSAKVNVTLNVVNAEMMPSNQILTINGFIRSLQWQNKEKLFC